MDDMTKFSWVFLKICKTKNVSLSCIRYSYERFTIKTCTYIHFIYFFNYQTLTELEKDPLKFFLNTVRI